MLGTNVLVCIEDEDDLKGVVKAVGRMQGNLEGQMSDLNFDVSEGDWVLCKPEKGHVVKYEGSKYMIIDQEYLLMTFDDPSKLE